jgi:hypothetical protein
LRLVSSSLLCRNRRLGNLMPVGEDENALGQLLIVEGDTRHVDDGKRLRSP